MLSIIAMAGILETGLFVQKDITLCSQILLMRSVLVSQL